MRINAGARANGLSYNQFMAGLKAARRRARPQGPRRPRDRRSGEVRRDRRSRRRPRWRNSRQRRDEIFERQAALLRRPLAALRARLPSARRRPAGRRRRPDLALGPAAAAARRTALPRARRRGVVGRRSTRRSNGTVSSCAAACAEQEVQTNEVQRSWALLPAFLSLADGRPLDLLELGPSAGLNLLWDRYAYTLLVRARGGRGRARASGDDRVPPPAALLERRVEVARRRGVDRSPIDVTTAEGARVLQCVRLGRPDRAARAAAAARSKSLRRDPPELIRGDYVARTAASSARPHRRRAARRLPDGVHDVPRSSRGTSACAQRSTTRVAVSLLSSSRRPACPHDDRLALEVERFPDGRPERVAVFDFHGAWLDWGR